MITDFCYEKLKVNHSFITLLGILIESGRVKNELVEIRHEYVGCVISFVGFNPAHTIFVSG